MLRAAEDAQLEGSVNTAEDALRVVRERFGAPREKNGSDA
jgi:hypothetical protein